MKKLKYMSMMGLAALLLTTWAACSDDTDASGGENPEEARAYTTVTIAVPNGVAETRASDPTAICCAETTRKPGYGCIER